MKLHSMLERAARLQGGATAAIDGSRSFDYRTVAERVRRLAGHFESTGLEPGARVAILAWNSVEYLEAYFAASRAGLILCPLNVRLAPAELAAILVDADARWLVADVEFAEIVERVHAVSPVLTGIVWIGARTPALQGVVTTNHAAVLDAAASSRAPRERAPDDVAQIYYTSGTTGRAKGVMLSQRNVSVHALGAIAELGIDDRDRWAHIAPMFHLADAWATFAVTWAGGTHVFLPRFEVRAALDLLEAQRVTITNLVPTMLNAMVKDSSARGRDFSSLRRILSGGAPIAPSVVREILDVFRCEYVQTYGMTETSPYLTLSLPSRRSALEPERELAIRCRTGRPFATVELRVVDEHGNQVPADDRTVGEIRARGETVTSGYWNLPEETRAAFVDGWLCTGDLATVDADGSLNIVDRKKDMILSGGENVFSTEVENALHAHPAVLEAAVFGAPDERLGELVCAAVVLRRGWSVDHEGLVAHCRESLARYKVPRRVVFVSELPRTGSGKIEKRTLRSRFASPSTGV